MKEAMISHVDRLRYGMFEKSARVVKDELEIMCQTTQFSLSEMVEDLLAKLERDYIRVLAGDQQVEADRQLRLMLRQPVAAFDHWFSELLRPGVVFSFCIFALRQGFRLLVVELFRGLDEMMCWEAKKKSEFIGHQSPVSQHEGSTRDIVCI